MKTLQTFLDQAVEILKKDHRTLAVCVAGSWITKEVDEFSDLDLVIITETKISKTEDMKQIAISLGELLTGFTGDHVGEKRLLICLYENPTLHVDLKFLTPEEFKARVENPTIIWEREEVITKLYKLTTSEWPVPDFQWLEDRFWVWIHYVATKLGRGELFEAVDFLSFLRNTVLGPLFHLKYKSLPRGVRKLEFILNNSDLQKLKNTIPEYSFNSIFQSISNSISLYQELRNQLYGKNIILQKKTENTSLNYLISIKEKNNV